MIISVFGGPEFRQTTYNYKSCRLRQREGLVLPNTMRREKSGTAPSAIRAAVFSGVLIVLLCGPLLLFCSERCGVNLPSWLTSADASYLAGGSQEVDFLGQCNIEGVLSGNLHDAVEAEVGNYVPTKAIALVANAGIQRFAIGASNAAFGWPCYPSSFGSTDLFVPGQEAIVKWPREGKSSEVDGLTNFSESVGSIAKRHEEITFVSYVVARSEASSANPARALVGRDFTATDAVGLMGEAMADAVVITNDPASLSEYYRLYFKSDHHWRAEGAVDAYNRLADILHKASIPEDVKKVEGPLYSGSYARNSLCLIEDIPTQLSCDFSSIELARGEESQSGNDHIRYRDASTDNKHWYFYDLFYDPFTSARGTGEGKLLLVSDSFGFSLIRPLAMGFSELNCSRALQADASTEESLEDMIDEIEPDVVLFVADPGNYATFCDRNPQFFN